MSTLDVSAIRPDTAQSAIIAEKAAECDIAWLLEKKDSFQTVSCPACGGTNFTNQLKKKGFVFNRCSCCKTLYMPLRPTAEILADFYTQSAVMSHFAKYIFPVSKAARIEHIYKPRLRTMLEQCEKAAALGGRYAEIGAGSGSYARLVQESRSFEQVLAVEPSVNLAADCRANGLTVLELPVEKLSDDMRLDVAASFEVLEHLFSPADFLRHMHRILVPNGLCILTTPNGLGLDVLELGAASSTVAFTHLTLFNPKSISELLQTCGFTVLEIMTPGKLDVGLLREAWSKGAPVSSPFLYHMLYEAGNGVAENFQRFVVENKLSSHMWVVAQKR